MNIVAQFMCTFAFIMLLIGAILLYHKHKSDCLTAKAVADAQYEIGYADAHSCMMKGMKPHEITDLLFYWTRSIDYIKGVTERLATMKKD